MKDTGAVDAVNKLISGELVANHTYLLQARMCLRWGYAKLAAHLEKEAVEEIGHATRLIDRVLELGGTPNTDRPPVDPGGSVPEMIDRTIELERKAVSNYRTAAVQCLGMDDLASHAMFTELVRDEEHHLLWAETQKRLIGEIGLQNFLTEWI